MKTIYNKMWVLAFLLLPCTLLAQQTEMQLGDTTYYKSLIPIDKQSLLKNMHMIANMRFALRNEFDDGNYDLSRYQMEQFRLEFRGQVTDKIYFRFRTRYTKDPEKQDIDNMSQAVDIASIRISLSNKVSLSLGKMCADWGGYEFDYNPIDIYEYSDIIEMADNFLTGAGISFQATKSHQFTFQLLDSRTKSFNELYGDQPNKVESKAPMAFVVNWRGSLFDGKFNTIWSYALHTEAQSTFMNYIALGNQLKLGKFTAEYDYKLSKEDLDRTGIVSTIVPDNLYPYAVENTLYIGHWLHLYYRVNPKINLAMVTMLDLAKWKDNKDPMKNTNDIRTAWGFIPTVEYYPFKDVNIRFFVNYVGRSYVYSDYAKSRLGAVDNTTGRLSFGFVSPLGIF